MEGIQVAYHAITWKEQFIQALDDISAAGFGGFETFARIVEDWEGRLAEFRALLAERGLRLVCLYGGGPLIDPERIAQDIEWNMRVARFLAANGADRLVLGGGTRRPEGNTFQDYRLMAQALNEIGRQCLDLGLKACYHPHWRTAVENREEIALLMELTNPDWLFLCPDTAHLVKGGSDPLEVIRAYIDRIAYVHLKDIPWRPEEALPSLEVTATSFVPGFLELGQGSIDFPAILSLLREHGYQGWITIELDTTERTPKESALLSKRYVEEVLGLKV